MKRIYGYQSNLIGDKLRETMENFFIAERPNKKAGRRIPRTLISGAEQSLR